MLLVVLSLYVLVPVAGADEDVFSDPDVAARKSSNPLGGDFMILLNQWNFDFLEGDLSTDTRHAVTHVFQPVIPISLGGDWIWVNRPTLPIIYDADVPVGPNQFDSESGIGDMVLFSLVGVSSETDVWGGGDVVLASGLTAQLPTGRKEFTSGKWSVGPAAVAAFIGKKFIVGALGQQWNSIGENRRNSDTFNFTNIQYFYFLNFPGGWQVGGAPQIEIDWEAGRSSDKVAFPIGLGVQKTQFFGNLPMPIKLGVEFQYYAVTPETYGKEWRIQFTFAPIIPNVIGGMFSK